MKTAAMKTALRDFFSGSLQRQWTLGGTLFFA